MDPSTNGTRRVLRRFLTWFFWLVLRMFASTSFWLLRSAFHFIASFEEIQPHYPEVTSTPAVRLVRRRTPSGVKSSLSAIKRNNRRSSDAEFEGRARRELFRSSPAMFLMESDRITKLPRRRQSFDSHVPRQRRLRF